MKTLTLALALLMLMLCSYPQLKAAPKNDTSSRHPEQGKGVVASGTDASKAASDQNTASANDQKHGQGNVAPPALKPFNCSERLRQWWDSRTTADLTLYVTTLYLIATVLIWLAMLASNAHAETAYKEGKADTEKSIQIARDGQADARRAAEAAERQLSAIIEVARARVTLGKIDKTTLGDAGEWPHEVVVHIINSGYTPAWELVFWGATGITPKGTEMSWDLTDDAERHSVTTVAARGDSPAAIRMIELSKEERAAALAGEADIWLFCKVEYRDIFEERRRSGEFTGVYDFSHKRWTVGRHKEDA